MPAVSGQAANSASHGKQTVSEPNELVEKRSAIIAVASRLRMPDRFPESRLTDAADIAAADRARAESDFTVPAGVLDAILSGKAPITAWREYRLMTEKALGLQAGVSQSTLSRMVKKQSQPRPATIEKLAAALNVPVWALTIDQ